MQSELSQLQEEVAAQNLSKFRQIQLALENAEVRGNLRFTLVEIARFESIYVESLYEGGAPVTIAICRSALTSLRTRLPGCAIPW